jgi:hypothetical protein
VCRCAAGVCSVALWGSRWVWLSRCLPPVGWLTNEAPYLPGFSAGGVARNRRSTKIHIRSAHRLHLPTPET